MMTGAARWLGWVMGLMMVALFLLLAYRMADGRTRLSMDRPLHADEAGQWSLLAAAQPHSATADRFHGPALNVITRGACAALGVDPAGLSERGMRNVPLLLGFTLFLPLIWRPSVGLGFLTTLAVMPMGRYIQEPLLATALAWTALLWLQADAAPPERAWRWRAAAGAFAGLALACKVTAALYLLVAALALAWLGRGAPARKGRVAFGLAMLLSWVFWQSSALADLPALGTWWSQLSRAFGLAAGSSVEPLRLVTYWPWVVSGACLGLVACLRWRRVGLPWGRHPQDALLLAAAAVYLIHLALPYQTPWLMLSVDTLVLVVLLPALSPRWLMNPESKWDPRFWAAVLACVAAADWTTQSRYAYVETRPAVQGLARVIRGLPGASERVVQVSGTNYWPLPYYLRGLPVGYGDFAGADQADVRWLEAQGAEAPAAPGYRVFPVELRDGELWWLRVSAPLADSVEQALRSGR